MNIVHLLEAPIKSFKVSIEAYFEQAVHEMSSEIWDVCYWKCWE